MVSIQATRKFPWQSFKQAWECRLACAFIPPPYVDNPMPTLGTSQHAHLLNEPLKPVLSSHLTAQAVLAARGDPVLQDNYFSLMASHPVVAASPPSIDIALKPKVTFKVKNNNAVLSGEKVRYLSGGVASFFLVHCREFANTAHSDTLFIIDKHRLGIEMQIAADENGHNMPYVSFHDVTVPLSHMIGDVGEAQELAELKTQQLSRLYEELAG